MDNTPTNPPTNPPTEPPNEQPFEEPTKDRAPLVTNWLLGAIVAVLIALVAVLMLRDDSPTEAGQTTTTVEQAGVTDSTLVGETTTVPEGTDTTLVTDTTTSESTTTTPVATTVPAPTPGDTIALATVSEWIAAVAAGDADMAWDLLDPVSQEAIGGRSGFDGSFTGLVEGYGAWASATDVITYSSPVLLVEPAELFLVSWVGTVSQEGLTADKAFAIPVTVNAQGAKVNPFARGELVEFVVPENTEPSAVFASITTLEFDIPTEAVAMAFLNGQHETNQNVQDLGNGKSRVYVTPETHMEVGASQVLSVLYFQDGLVHAEAVRFVIGEDS